jgi:acyl-coenzyme A thioesterase PaaI-like protein
VNDPAAQPPRDEPADERGRALARALADELRTVAELLNTRAVPPDALDGALATARALRAGLDEHPASARWYELVEHGAGGREASRGFHDEQGPLRGLANVVAPPLRAARATRADGTVVLRGTVRLGHRYEGPPRAVHGGIVAALFDELLGSAQSQAGVRGMTAKLTIRYRKPTPVDEDLTFEAWIDRERGRSVVLLGTCHARGQLVAQAEGLFMRVDFDAVQRRLRDDADAAAAAAVESTAPGAPG